MDVEATTGGASGFRAGFVYATGVLCVVGLGATVGVLLAGGSPSLSVVLALAGGVVVVAGQVLSWRRSD